MADALTGGGLVWAGANGLAADAVPPGIYAPDPWEPGASFSHLREDMYLSGNANALMTPNLNTGEAIHDPGPIVMGMFADMGWGVEGCVISAMLAGAQSPCNPETNTFSQQVILIYDDAPAGLLNVNGSLFTVTGSPQIVSLNNLPANGAPVDVTAYFTGDPACTATQASLFTAPESCAGGTCEPVSATIGPQSPCNPDRRHLFPTGHAPVCLHRGPRRRRRQRPDLPGEQRRRQHHPDRTGGRRRIVNLAITFTGTTPAGSPSSTPGPHRLPVRAPSQLDVANIGACVPPPETMPWTFLLDVVQPPPPACSTSADSVRNAPGDQGTFSARWTASPADGQSASAGAFFTDLPSCTTPPGRHMGRPRVPAPVPMTSTDDGIVGVSDTLDLLANFGCAGSTCTGDLDGDGLVGVCRHPRIALRLRKQLLIPRIERFLPRSVFGMRMPIKLASHFR